MGLMPTAPAASPAFLMAAGAADASAQPANGVAAGVSPFASLLGALGANGQQGQGAKGNQPSLPQMPGGQDLPVEIPSGEQEVFTGEEAILAISQLLAPAMPLENLVNLASNAGETTATAAVDATPSTPFALMDAPGETVTTAASDEILAPATSAALSHAAAPVSTVANEAFAGSADAILPALPELKKDDRPAAPKLDISAMEPVEAKIAELAPRQPVTSTDVPVARDSAAPATQATPAVFDNVLMRAFAMPGGAADVLPIYTAIQEPQAPLNQQPALPADPVLPQMPPVEPANPVTAPAKPAPGMPPLEPPGLTTPTNANGVVRTDGNANTEKTQPAAPATNVIPAGNSAAVTRPSAPVEANTPAAATTIAQANGATRANSATAKSGVLVERANGIERPVEADELSDEAIDGAAADGSAGTIPAQALAEAVVPATSAAPAQLNREGPQSAAIDATGDVRGVSLNTPAQPARSDAAQAPVQADAPASSQSAQLSEPTRQVASAVLEQVEAGGGDARLHLQPRELGDVVIHVRTRGDVVEVTVQAERAEAVAMLRDNANELSGLLGDRGLNLADLNVGLGMQQQNRGQQWEPTALPNNSRRSNGEFAQLLGNEQPSAAPAHRRLQAAYNPDGRHIYRI